MNELDSLFAEPSDEDLQAVRTRTLAEIRHRSASRSTPPWYLWPIAAMLLLVVLRLVHHSSQPQPSVALTQVVSLPAQPLPLREINTNWHPARRHFRQQPLSAGLRRVQWTTNDDGRPELRLQTADPNVIILLQVNAKAQEN